MKVDTIPLAMGQNAAANDMPLIKADDIKSILYLGIKGEIKLEGTKHTVDTYA